MSILTAVMGSCGGGVVASTFATPYNTSMVIGAACAGGYYAGRIIDAGVTYALIVSPKASGGNGGATLAWKNANTTGPTGVQTLTNGLNASTVMAAAGAGVYPAAYYCRGLSINSYSDWYLPARDELEVLYRNLKPGTTASYAYTAYRSAAVQGITGYGIDGGDNGYNANSSPVGAAYTSASPAQTTVAVFKAAGGEDLVANNYWSATECTATNAWNQNFNNGNQNINNKTNANYVRAVRRYTYTLTVTIYVHQH